MSTMQCDVVSVQESLYSGAVTMLIAKGAGGELGIMPGHAPLVTLLKPGTIRVLLENGTEELIYVSGGVLEVQPHVVTVLADTAVRAENLDEAAILEARKHAEQLLANQKSDLTRAVLWVVSGPYNQFRSQQNSLKLGWPFSPEKKKKKT